MHHTIRASILIVAAMVGSALVLLGLIWMATTMSILASEPADFLPSSQTEVLVHMPTEADLKFWGERYPFLQELNPESLYAFAVVAVGDTKEVIAFHTDTSQPHTIGHFGIQVSNETVLPLLTSQRHTLGKYAVYKTMRTSLAAKTPWTFVRMTPASSYELRSIQTLFMGKERELGYSLSPSALRLMHVQQENPLLADMATTVPYASERILAINIANAPQKWSTWKETMTTSDSIVTEGLLRSLTSHLGSNVSFTFDILPLLQQPSVLQVSASGGILSTLLSGSMDNREHLNAIMERLHASYAQTLQSTRVTKRVLDKRFSSIDLRYDKKSILYMYEPLYGWSVTSTSVAPGEHGLFTAVKGSQYIMTERRSTMLSALQQTDTLVATAHILPKRLATALQIHLPDISTMLMSLREAPLTISSLRTNDLHIWNLESPEISLKLLDSLL
ncbi:hypothetical protein H6770_02965 [Candidatus Peribacteria bacterium]|nr:hypothetical protein [Candidatus Peribacteria bacterium]